MNIIAARANVGLAATAEITSSNVFGNAEIGILNNFISLSDCNVAYTLTATICDSAVLSLNVANGSTIGSTAFVTGTAQVETATASGTVAVAGNALITLTSSGLAGSPIAISVPVAVSDTATLWAIKVRSALVANAVIAERFAISGSGASIILTRKPDSFGLFVANDSTLNLAIAPGTATGINAATTSANTTAGVVSSGAKIYDGDGKDFEGITIPTIVTLKAILIQNTNSPDNNVVLSNFNGIVIDIVSNVVVIDNIPINNYLIQSDFISTGISNIIITVIGKTS